jgi:hypothetical protein
MSATEPTPLTWEQVDKTAATLGASAAQRRKWRQIGRQVPDTWRIRIVDALKGDGIVVDFKQFDELTPRPGRIATGDGQ